jgi:hypothetical protein
LFQVNDEALELSLRPEEILQLAVEIVLADRRDGQRGLKTSEPLIEGLE